MKRALVAAMAATLLVSTGVTAQDRTPAPTLAPDASWPAGLELRQDLADIGWHWGARLTMWQGGPRWLGDEADHSVSLSYSTSGDDLHARVGLRSSEMVAEWPYNVGSDWTALMELMDRLPFDAGTRDQVLQWVGEDEAGCDVHPLPAGSVMVDHFSEAYRELVAVTIQQGVVLECPEQPAPMTAAETPAADAPADGPSDATPAPEAAAPELTKKAAHTSEDDPDATHGLVSGRYRLAWDTPSGEDDDGCEHIEIGVIQQDGDFEYVKSSTSARFNATVNDLPEGVYKLEQRDETCEVWELRIDWMTN